MDGRYRTPRRFLHYPVQEIDGGAMRHATVKDTAKDLEELRSKWGGGKGINHIGE